MNEYEWHATIISKNRITIPNMISNEWHLMEGDRVHVTVRRVTKQTRDVVL